MSEVRETKLETKGDVVDKRLKTTFIIILGFDLFGIKVGNCYITTRVAESEVKFPNPIPTPTFPNFRHRLPHLNKTWMKFGCQQFCSNQARNQLGTPGGAKSFPREAQISWTMSNIFKLCPTHFSRGEKIFLGGLSPLVTGLVATSNQAKSWYKATILYFNKSFKRNCTISTGIPSLGVQCKKWFNWTSGVGFGQKIRLRLLVLLGIRLHPKTSDFLRLRHRLCNLIAIQTFFVSILPVIFRLKDSLQCDANNSSFVLCGSCDMRTYL